MSSKRELSSSRTRTVTGASPFLRSAAELTMAVSLAGISCSVAARSCGWFGVVSRGW